MIFPVKSIPWKPGGDIFDLSGEGKSFGMANAGNFPDHFNYEIIQFVKFFSPNGYQDIYFSNSKGKVADLGMSLEFLSDILEGAWFDFNKYISQHAVSNFFWIYNGSDINDPFPS